jgi:hypothetical protein
VISIYFNQAEDSPFIPVELHDRENPMVADEIHIAACKGAIRK